MGAPAEDRPEDRRLPHVAQVADESPEHPPDRPPPVPTSTFASFKRLPRKLVVRSQPARHWEARCGHTIMTRLYQGSYKCESCGRSGHFGWVYRCIEDRDAIIMDLKARSARYAFDKLGLVLGEQMSLGKFGADRRYKKYSFLTEITEDQLHTYTPAQLGIVMTQRDNVHRRIFEERCNPARPNHAAQKYPDDGKPWVPSRLWECQHKICQECNRSAKEKSWLSLDSIVNGDIPPHAATGFSFCHLGFRPEADVEVVRNIGYHAVPLPADHPARRLQRSASASTWRMLGIVDERIETATCSTCSSSTFDTTSDESDDSDHMPQIAQPRGQLTHSAAVQTLPRSHTDPAEAPSPTTCAATDDGAAGYSIFEENLFVRPPWTPPPSPSIATMLASGAPEHFVVPGREGRSPLSLKANPMVRAMVFGTIPGANQGCDSRAHQGHGCGTTAAPQFPYRPEEMCDVGLVLSLKPEVYAQACGTALPKPTMEERLYFAKCSDDIKAEPEDEETLSDKPCDIVDGVALTEEAIECGTDDVVAHVGISHGLDWP
ncbi:hypothetical protein B0T14DRAFT_186834 [Immersiella caudata]|uniref:Uncharacterized protein n=1 Tax=Immersiella caudata TaxID=314043 RepID=A0AA39WYE6_9PEZI|nr:hypothetical protein B0T14DRAFT_186834 [Immersiella caudata]